MSKPESSKGNKLNDISAIHLQIDDDQLKDSAVIKRKPMQVQKLDQEPKILSSNDLNDQMTNKTKKFLCFMLLLVLIITLYVITSKKQKIYYFLDSQNLSCVDTQENKITYLYQDECVDSCPDGYTSDELDHFCQLTQCVPSNVHFQRFNTSEYYTKDVFFHIFEPATYHYNKDANKFYPSVFIFTGLNQDYNWYHSNFELQCLATQMETIFVVIAGNSSWYIDTQIPGAKSCLFQEAMITQELITKIEKQWRLSDDPKDQILAGFDAGGYAALRLATKQPFRFGAAFAYNSVIDMQNALQFEQFQSAEQVFDEEYETDLNVLQLVHNQTEALKTNGVFYDLIYKENFVLKDDYLQLEKMLQNRNIAHNAEKIGNSLKDTEVFQQHILANIQEYLNSAQRRV